MCGQAPTDRPVDSVDASAFLLGARERTGRETLLFFDPDGSLMSSKWHNVKAVFRHAEGIDKPILEPQFPIFFDLGSDPGERYNPFEMKLDMGWCTRSCTQPLPSTRKALPSTRTFRQVRISTDMPIQINRKATMISCSRHSLWWRLNISREM
jgi:hypothetical protein